MGTRRVTVKRGALYTADPLLPDTTGSACRLPGLHGSASNMPGGCKKVSRPLRAPEGCSAKNATTGEMHWSCGVHCASFLLFTCTTGMGRISPCPSIRNKRARALENPAGWGLRKFFLTLWGNDVSAPLGRSFSSAFLYNPSRKLSK